MFLNVFAWPYYTLRSGVCMFLFPCVVFLFLPFPWSTVDLLSSVTEVFQSRQDGQVADSGLAEKSLGVVSGFLYNVVDRTR